MISIDKQWEGLATRDNDDLAEGPKTYPGKSRRDLDLATAYLKGTITGIICTLITGGIFLWLMK